MLRRMLARCAALVPVRYGAGDGVGILTYHRVVPAASGHCQPTWSVTPAALERQLAGLIARGFQPLPLSALIGALEDRRPLPRRSFAVTFDDGYRNNYDYAWPVLRKHQVPATFFLATRYLDGHDPFPFEDWRPAKRGALPPCYWQALSRGQCFEMRDGGLIEFGSHTHSHECFGGRLHEFRLDLEESLDFFRREFGVSRPPFAFPFGFSVPEMISVVRSLPFRCAVTTRTEPLRGTADLFDLGRFNVEQCDDPDILTAKLDGRYNVLCAALNRCLVLGQRRERSRPGVPRRSWWSRILPSAALPRSPHQ